MAERIIGNVLSGKFNGQSPTFVGRCDQYLPFGVHERILFDRWSARDQLGQREFIRRIVCYTLKREIGS